jgi:hypothetical protein
MSDRHCQETIAKKKAAYLPGDRLLCQNDDELLNALMMAQSTKLDFYLLVQTLEPIEGLTRLS